MKERVAVKDLKPGLVDSTFLITQAEPAKTKADKQYMRFTFSDVTGAVTGMDWSPTPAHLTLQPGAVVHVKGKYSVDATYGPQLVVSSISAPLENYNEAAFAAQCPNDMKEVGYYFEMILDAVDPPFDDFVRDVLDGEGDKSGEFWTAPASHTLHQAYVGGLAEHSVQVADIALYSARWCKGLDGTVLVVAGLLHDIAKPIEYEGLGREYTDIGKLIGNTALSYQTACGLIQFWMEENPGVELDEGRVDHIRHCIIAHHGRKEWGSPVTPRTMEANLIHFADMISSRIGGYQRLLRETPPGQLWSSRDLMFDGQLWIPQNVQDHEEKDFQEAFTFPEDGV